ncbi:MAG: hypothetical protein P9M08_11885 [Candidatus Erginobacter occultus]|nr:hypothetical protein [Candidatus Erginobacter occultus]
MSADRDIRPRPPLLTVGLILLCYLSLTYAWENFRNTNEYSRIFLTRAMIEHQSFSIDPLLKIHDTQDKSDYQGHHYSNKAPASSFLAAPAYLAVRLAEILGRFSASDAVRLYLVTSLTVSVPSALFLLLLFKFWSVITLQGPLRRAVLILYGLGTMAWPYSTMYYGHIPAALGLALAFLIVFSARDAVTGSRPILEAGFFCGLAFAIEYPTALISAALFLYGAAVFKKLRAGIYQLAAMAAIFFLWSRLDGIEAAVAPHIESLVDPAGALLVSAIVITAVIGLGAASRGPGLLLFFLGAAIPVGLTFYYHNSCFGGPLQFPYYHETYPLFNLAHQRGIAGVSLPADPEELLRYLDRLWRLLVSPYRGLFFYSPFLLFGTAGMVKMVRSETWRREGILFLSLSGLYLLFLAAFSDWEGGWSMGPRHLVPLLPFLATGVVYGLARIRPERRVVWGTVLAAAGLISIGFTFVGTVTFPYFPKEFLNPLYDPAGKLLQAGRIAPTVGELFGLRGWSRILPAAIPAALLAALFLKDTARFAARSLARQVLLIAAAILAAGILLRVGVGAGQRRAENLSARDRLLQEEQRGRMLYFMEREGEGERR